ncbi:uncharacterized protein LOC133795872 [Humulus lupulus]|uniref:uncharacterized protein LOC133795872 n=1 Tax=Humulus lupulus TaxID=3486 RepID=UPI002B415AFD|nr:uncharacterized protein LOC133795872 [Humulus lupulus]
MNEQVNSTWLEAEKEKLEEALLCEELFWRQKSRIQWLKEGGRSTKFFHVHTLVKRRRNAILHLKGLDGKWMEGAHQIATIFQNHHSEVYGPNRGKHKAKLEELIFKVISDDQNNGLIEILDADEIQKTLNKMGVDKAPCPDGMSFSFYKHHWETVQKDLINMVQFFFYNNGLLMYIKNTNFVFIPKKENPVEVRDYWLIALSKLKDALKASQAKFASSEPNVNDLKAELDTKTADFNAARVKIDCLKAEMIAAKAETERLKEEKNSAFEILEDEKHMLEEFKAKKDWATNWAMYMMWSLNPEMDTSFLQDKEWLADEEVTTATLDGRGEEEKVEEVESASTDKQKIVF